MQDLTRSDLALGARQRHSRPSRKTSESVRRDRRVGGEECGRLAGERVVNVEQGAVPGIRICQNHRVWQVLTEPVGVGDGDHLIMDAVHDQDWLTNAPEAAEALSRELLPFTKSCDLSLRDRWPRGGLSIGFPLGKPFDKLFPRRLARLSGSKEDLDQDGVPFEHRIPEVPGETGFFQVHDVLAASWSGARQDHPAK